MWELLLGPLGALAGSIAAVKYLAKQIEIRDQTIADLQAEVRELHVQRRRDMRELTGVARLLERAGRPLRKARTDKQ